jgi:hypothetical protein
VAVPAPPVDPSIETLARRYAASAARLEEVRREHDDLRRALVAILRQLPERTVACPGGRYRLFEEQGVEELRWEEDAPQEGAKDAKT